MWTLNGIRIFVQEFPESTKQIIARLQPVNAGTVHQTFGYEKKIINLSAIAVGETDKDALHSYTTTGLGYDLVTPWGTVSDVYVSTVSSSPRITISQTLRTDLDCDATVYDVSIELYVP